MKVSSRTLVLLCLLLPLMGHKAQGSELADARLGDHENFTRAVIITEKPLDSHCDISADGRTATLHFDRPLAIKRGKMVHTRTATFTDIATDPQDSLQILFRNPVRLAYKNTFAGPDGNDYRLALDFVPLSVAAPQEQTVPPPSSESQAAALPRTEPDRAPPPRAAAESPPDSSAPVVQPRPPTRPRATGLEVGLGLPFPPFGASRTDILAGISRMFGPEQAVIEMSSKLSPEASGWIVMLDTTVPVMGPARALYFLTSKTAGLYKIDLIFGESGVAQDPLAEAIERQRLLDRLLVDVGHFTPSSPDAVAVEAVTHHYVDGEQRIASTLVDQPPTSGDANGAPLFSVHLSVTGPPSPAVETGAE